MTLKLALLRAGRRSPKFLCNGYSSPDEVKMLSSTGIDTDLIVSSQLIKGFEHSVIIDMEGYHSTYSRSTSKLIKVFPNLFLDVLFVYKKLLKNKHNCNHMKSLSVNVWSQMTKFSLSTMLGKQALMKFWFLMKIVCHITLLCALQ